jgi:diadenosine tetraphosphate (Ap4A) HIT family hydrolase
MVAMCPYRCQRAASAEGSGAFLTLYCTDNYRTEEQLAQMRRLEAAGICLFCPDSLREHARQRVIHETAHWAVTPNAFPYAGTRLHLLVVPRRHVNDMLDLDDAALAGFWAALRWAREEYGLGSYGLGVRNGNCSFTGATIAHVHAHVLVGDPDAEPEVPVRMRFSSRPRA